MITPRSSLPFSIFRASLAIDEHFVAEMTLASYLLIQCVFCFYLSSHSLPISSESEAIMINCGLVPCFRNPLVHEVEGNSPGMVKFSEAHSGPCSCLLCWTTKSFYPFLGDRRKQWVEFSCWLWGQIPWIWGVTKMGIFVVVATNRERWLIKSVVSVCGC